MTVASRPTGSLVTVKTFPTDMQSSPFNPSQTGQSQSGQMGGVQQQFQGQMTGGLERMRDWLQNWIQNAADTLRVYVNQYPPLAAFLFTLLVLSAVPISVYVVFGLVTSAIFLTIALVGFSLVEGFILLTSGGILMTILGGIGLFTTIGFAVITSIYLGYRSFSFLASNVWQAGGQISGQMREAAQRMQPSGYSSGFGQTSGMTGGTSGATSS